MADTLGDARPNTRLVVLRGASILAMCALVLSVVLALSAGAAPARASALDRSSSFTASGPRLARLAAARPSERVEVIAQFQPDRTQASTRRLIRAVHATDVRDLPIIHGFAARMTAAAAGRLAQRPGREPLHRAASASTRRKLSRGRGSSGFRRGGPTVSEPALMVVSSAKAAL
jgi:hypothetical protein